MLSEILQRIQKGLLLLQLWLLLLLRFLFQLLSLLLLLPSLGQLLLPLLLRIFRLIPLVKSKLLAIVRYTTYSLL